MNIEISLIAVAAATAALGIIYGERQARQEIREQMNDERMMLKDTMNRLSETHNAFALTQKSLVEQLGDLDQKVNIMMSGFKK